MKGVFIGVDPSVHNSGFAIREEPRIHFGKAKLENIEGYVVSWVLRVPPELPIFVAIECPSWSGPGTKEVRVAARTWERVLKKAFPRRVQVLQVDPRHWQRLLLKGVPGDNTKEQATFRARNVVLRDASAAIGSDEADALCLLEYCEMQERSGVFAEIREIEAAKRKQRIEKSKARKSGEGAWVD